MTNFIEGNTFVLNIDKDETIKPIVNPTPIVHIKGNGSTLTINTVHPYGVAIGADVYDVSYGRYSIREKCILEKVIIDNVHVIVNETNEAFSLGTYNKQNNIEIECINGGVIECPEVRGISSLQYSAEPPEASTKYYQLPYYALLDTTDEFEYNASQLEALGDAKDMFDKSVTTRLRPAVIKFLVRNMIVPSPGLFDTNISSYYIEMLEAALKFGCRPEDVYNAYQEFKYKNSALFMEYVIKVVMFKHVVPDLDKREDEFKRIQNGELGLLFKLGGKPLPEVTDESAKYLKYLLPLDASDISKENIIKHLNNCGTEEKLTMNGLLLDSIKELYGDISIKLITEDSRLKYYKASNKEKDSHVLIIYDDENKMASSFEVSPFMMSSLVMSGSTKDLQVFYLDTIVRLSKDMGAVKAGTYIANDELDEKDPQLHEALRVYVDDGRASYKYDRPILHYHGAETTGKVIHSTWLRE